MEDKQAYEVLSNIRVLDVGVVYQAEFLTNTTLGAMFTWLTGKKTITDSWILKLGLSTKVYTETGEASRDKAATDLSIGASVASAYGEEHGIDELKSLKMYTYSELRQCPLTNQVADSKIIMEAINNHHLALESIGIDAALILTFEDDITQMELLTKIPQTMIDQHKNDKNLFLKHLTEIRNYYEKKTDQALELYRLKNINFYLAYLAARKVRHHHLKRKLKPIDPETTTGILELLVLLKDTMEPAVGANFLALILNISELTDIDGETYNDELAPGTYEGILHLDGYQTINFSFTIEAGKTTTLQFLMEREVPIPVPPMP